MFLNLFSFVSNVFADEDTIPPFSEINCSIGASMVQPPATHTDNDTQRTFNDLVVWINTYNNQNVLNFAYFNDSYLTDWVCSGDCTGTDEYAIIYTNSWAFAYCDTEGQNCYGGYMDPYIRGLMVREILYSTAPIRTLSGAIYRPSDLPQLTVALNPQAGGTVASSPTSNFSCADGTCTGNFSGNVTLTASVNSGYQLINWYENGTIITNNCPTTILDLTVNCTRSISAEFIPVLKWPLTGTKSSRSESWNFGSTWTYGECPTGTYKKHSGIDVNATAEEAVYAAHDGVVKKIFTGQHSQWADAIVIESTDGRFTTVYWHVIKYGSLSENDTVTKGQQIATIANLESNTHFHFGVRFSLYSDPESYAGALPVAGCGGYLAYPEKFIDPDVLTYE